MTCGKARPVVLVKKTTREVVKRYPSASAAGINASVSRVNINRDCRQRRLGAGDLYWRFEDDFDPNESFAGIKVRRPVLAINRKTGHWLWFESISEAGMHFYGNPRSAGEAMRNDRTKNGYTFVYADRRMRSEKCEVGV